MAKPVFVKGGRAGIDAYEVSNGQLLFDVDNKCFYLDTVIDDTPTRLTMFKKPFIGTMDAWEALSDEQKAYYADTFVDITDDVEPERPTTSYTYNQATETVTCVVN